MRDNGIISRTGGSIEKVKKIEYWAFYALATAEDIRKITEGKSTDDQDGKDDQDTNE